MSAWCPVCPNVWQIDIEGLTSHLRTFHQLYSSAHILARIIVYTPYGREEVSQVLKDVQSFQNKLNNSHKTAEVKQIKQLNNYYTYSKKEDLQRHDQDSSSDHDRIRPEYSDQSCQTDTVENNNNDTSEIVDLEINGKAKEKNTDKQFWNKLVDGKNSEIYKLHQKIANLDSKAKSVDNSVAELKAQLHIKCREKSVLEKDFRKYREKKRELDTKVDNLERGVKELGVQLSKKREENSLLNKELKKYKDYSFEVISVKDKKITSLITKEQNLNRELGDLKVELSKKVDDLKVELSKYKKHNTEILSQNDEIILNLNSNAKILENDSTELKDELSKQSEEKNLEDVEDLKVELSQKHEEIALLGMNFNKVEERNIEIISEKDVTISNLNAKVTDLEENIKEWKIQLSCKNEEKLLCEKDLQNQKELLSEKDETITNLNAKVRDLEENVQASKIQLSYKNEEKLACEKDLQSHKEQMAKLLSEKVLKISELGLKAENLEKDLVKLKVLSSQKCEEKILIEQDFEKLKDCSNKNISEKDQKIKNLVEDFLFNDNKTKELEQDIMKYKERTNEEIAEKDRKIVTLSQKAKNMNVDTEELRVQLSEKCKEITIIEQDLEKYKDWSENEMSVKDLEIKNLGIKVNNLANDITEINAQFSKLQQDFKKYRKSTNEEISEKDQKIGKLDIVSKNHDKEKIIMKKDFKKYKELTDVIISKYKLKNEETLADMNDKMKRYRDIFCLMKDSITGMAAMHDDTSDKLIEAVNNSSQASKVVGNDLVCRFQELEKVVTRISQDKINTFPQISVRKDIFKSETIDAWQPKNCQLERSSYDDVQYVGSLGETCGKEIQKNLKRKFPD